MADTERHKIDRTFQKLLISYIYILLLYKRYKNSLLYATFFPLPYP